MAWPRSSTTRPAARPTKRDIAHFDRQLMLLALMAEGGAFGAAMRSAGWPISGWARDRPVAEIEFADVSAGRGAGRAAGAADGAITTLQRALPPGGRARTCAGTAITTIWRGSANGRPATDAQSGAGGMNEASRLQIAGGGARALDLAVGQCRLGQDPGADRPGGAAAAGGHAAAEHPLPDLSPRPPPARCRTGCSAGWAAGRCAAMPIWPPSWPGSACRARSTPRRWPARGGCSPAPSRRRAG